MAHDPDVLRGLADELEAGTQGAHGLGKIAMICTKEEWALIIAALRAPQGDGAEAMREACAQEAERVVKVPARMIGGMRIERLPMAPRTPREIAAAIRERPLSSLTKTEGGER